MFEWEEKFRPHILERGWKYAEKGAVTDLKKTDNSITAVVRGSEYYKVDIRYDGDMIIDGFCTCPYATGGEWCKHIAAVLYTVDHGKEQTKNEPPLDRNKETTLLTPIKDLVKSADRKELESMLTELAYSDERIASHIRASFQKPNGVTETGVIKKEIDEVFSAYSDRNGFIDYYNAYSFASNLNAMLKNRGGELIDNELYMDAFDISVYAFVKLGNNDIDDDGEIESISSTCYEIWLSIISHCTPEEKVKIKEWFVEHSEDGTVVDYMEGTLQDFLKYELASEDDLREIIRELEDIVEDSKGMTKCRTVFSSYYGYNIEAIELRNILVKRLGTTEKEIEDYMSRYMSFRSVREHFLEKAEEQGKVDEEIRLLKESKLYEKESPYTLHTYSRRLIELYNKRKDTESAKIERREDILANQGATLEDLKLYRNMCTDDEWYEERLNIIRSRKDVEKKCEFLAEENMSEELFNVIREQKNKINLINKYGVILSEDHSREILDFYTQYVTALAERACNRSRYDELIRYLMRMSQYPGGKELTKCLALEWIEKYPSRKVMTQELIKWSNH